MSCLNSGLILILISILMTKVNFGNGRSFKDKYELQFGKSSSHLRPYNSIRHNHHYYGRKHKDNNFYYHLSHYMSKPRRFTALDKVDDRLDNAAVYFSEKHQKFTTSTPSADIWEDNSTPNSSLFADIYMSNFINFKDDKAQRNRISHKHDRERFRELEKIFYSDLDGEDGDSKEYLQDFTTPKPLENFRQDATYGAKLNSTTLKSSTTTESSSDKANILIPRRPFFESYGDESKKTISTTLDSRVPEALAKHLAHVHKEGRCHTPRAKIIKVHEVHPNPSKLYSPSCTILHRCGADTGCCQSLKDVCKPKNITKVELYFYTTIMGQAHKVEKLQFENHTECECRSRTEDLMPRDSSYAKSIVKSKIITGRFGSQGKVDNCTCPSLFSPRYLHNGSCVCDCFDKQIDCLTRKKGKANFPFDDRLCIKQKICSQPSCEFGIYNASNGRCPKRNEKSHHSRHRPYASHVRIT